MDGGSLLRYRYQGSPFLFLTLQNFSYEYSGLSKEHAKKCGEIHGSMSRQANHCLSRENARAENNESGVVAGY
jgi:hypothetical protein